MRILITGNTGFKGAWFTALLHELGHEVFGLATLATNRANHPLAEVSGLIVEQFQCDVRHLKTLSETMARVQPDVVIHFAAMAIVSDCQESPLGALDTNIIGGINVLRACLELESRPTLLFATTDKVYLPLGNEQWHVESDQLGGIEPYSYTKSAADFVAQQVAGSFPDFRVGVVRAGNVIGGGDRSKHRLIPDAVRAWDAGEALQLHNPSYVRPWQHVLDCLWGYWKLTTQLIDGQNVPREMNFGPPNNDTRSVGQIAGLLVDEFAGLTLGFGESRDQIVESSFLGLDSSLAAESLSWSPVMTAKEAVTLTAAWERAVRNGSSPLAETRKQIQWYLTQVRL